MSDFTVSSFSSVAQLIQARQADLGASDHRVAAALGYPDEKVVRVIKKGAMRLPVKHVPELAGVLDVDAADLLRLVLRENDPSLLDVIERVMGPVSMSPSEIRLLRGIRNVSKGDSPITMILDGEIPVRLVIDHAVWKGVN